VANGFDGVSQPATRRAAPQSSSLNFMINLSRWTLPAAIGQTMIDA
jgi:hypothetical protein